MTVTADYALPVPLGVTAYRAPNPEPPYDLDVPGVARPDLPGWREAPPVGVQLRLVPDPPGSPEAARDPFASWPTPRSALEDPRPRAAVLARAFLEALYGERPLGQLARWAAADVLNAVEPLVVRTARRSAATVRRVIVTEPVPGVAEVTAVVQRGARAGAMAFRLEGRDGRWIVTALQLG